jgi:hypothetical protein
MKGFVVIFLIGVIMFGCAGKDGNSRNLSNPRSIPTPGDTPSSVSDVEIKAKAQGNTVFIHIRNNMDAPLRISPYFFALIIDNKKPEIRFHPSLAEAELPVSSLTKGVEVSGRIRFFNYDDLLGQKLIFNSPDYKPIMTLIEEYIAE